MVAPLAAVVLGLAGCGGPGKTPMAVESSAVPVQVYAAGSLR